MHVYTFEMVADIMGHPVLQFCTPLYNQLQFRRQQGYFDNSLEIKYTAL